jgi:SAM-dependent methyltransferase
MVAQITDKRLLRERLRRAHARGGDAGFLLKQVATDLAERIAGFERSFGLAVIHGAQSDSIVRALLAGSKTGDVLRLEHSSAALLHSVYPGAVGDEEALPLSAGTIGLFLSILALQWTNDLPGALIQVRRALRPDGIFLAAMTGGDTLAELREALSAAEAELRGGTSPRVLPAADLRDMGALLQRAGFALPVTDRDVLTVRYDSAFDLYRDLRAMGASNALFERDRRPSGRTLFLRAAEIYAERFSDPDGRIRATFEIVFLTGQGSDPSRAGPGFSS